jgi:predicted RNA methylase
MSSKDASKELYSQLRRLSCEALWTTEVPRFDAAPPAQRADRAALVRAVGVVFSESGSPAQKEQARAWLRGLLKDPNESVRRHAMRALPKIGAGPEDEARLLSLLRSTSVEREKRHAAKTLEKIGGAATLEETLRGGAALPAATLQKVQASLARAQNPGALQPARVLAGFSGWRIHLRGRRGLEEFVRDEAQERLGGRLRAIEVREGLTALEPLAPFSLNNIYSLRCFGSAGFVLGRVANTARDEDFAQGIAALIAAPRARELMRAFTDGPLRYRLEFPARGHQRGLVSEVAQRAHAISPEPLNDARGALWTVDVFPADGGHWVELRPKLAPDPRFAYRQGDVPAASHPPLAACIARLGGAAPGDVVWDPFCGSGLELIERSLLPGALAVYGSDLDPEAVAIARKNFAAAIRGPVTARIEQCDFRDFARVTGLGPDSLTLILTNPPLGKRVPIPNLRGLLDEMFRAAARLLRPGGRLVLANPFDMPNPHPLLKLEYKRAVDLGGIQCRLEKYVKVG